MGLIEVLKSPTVALNQTNRIQATVQVSKVLLYSGAEASIGSSNIVYWMMYDSRSGKSTIPESHKSGSGPIRMTITKATWGCMPVARDLHIAPMYFMFGTTTDYIYVDIFIGAPSVIPQTLSEVQADDPPLICGYRISNMSYAFAMGARRRVTYYLDGTDRDESIDIINIAGEPRGYLSLSASQTPVRSGIHEVEGASANINISPPSRLFALASGVSVSSIPSSYTLTVNHTNTTTPTIK